MKHETADTGFWSRNIALPGVSARGLGAGLVILAILPGLVASRAESQEAATAGHPKPRIVERLFRVGIGPAGGAETEKDPDQAAHELTCLYRCLLPVGQEPFVCRLLCLDGGAPWMAVYSRVNPNDRFPFQRLVVDLADGQWIRFRGTLPKAARVEDGENTPTWMFRLSSGEFGRFRVRIDTDMLRFDPIEEDEELGPFARRVAQDVRDRQPELAAFLSWNVTWLSTDEGRRLPVATELLYDLTTLAGFQPEETGLQVKSEKIDARVVFSEEPGKSLDPDLESAFGKWASWPDFPRLDG